MGRTERQAGEPDEQDELFDEEEELLDEQGGLTDDEMDRLQIRYEMWGVDRVREELERPDRDQFVHPDVTAFAHEWLEAKEAAVRRSKDSTRILAIAACIVIGAAVASFLGY